MSEPAAEPAARPRRGGNVFTQKIGPLPMWAWVGIAGTILIIWRLYASKQQSQSSQQDQSTPADQVPQFVNQTYTTVTAPSAPAGPAGPPGPAGPAGPGGPMIPAPHPAPRPRSRLGSVTGLRTTGTGATNVRLSWNPDPGAQRYQVRVTYQDKVVKTFMTDKTTYNVTGLSPNRTYGLHVVGISGNDWAPEASIVQKTA